MLRGIDILFFRIGSSDISVLMINVELLIIRAK